MNVFSEDAVNIDDILLAELMGWIDLTHTV